MRRSSLCVMLLFVSSCADLPAQTRGFQMPVVAPPPPPATIARLKQAHTVFLGDEGGSPDWATRMIGGMNGSYDALYAALTQWGKYQLVDSSDKADLVFEIYGDEEDDDGERDGRFGMVYSVPGPRYTWFQLRIVDPKTNALLGEVDSPGGLAGSLKKGQKKFYQSVQTLTDKLKVLVGETPTGTVEWPVPPPLAPVPAVARNAKRVFIENIGSQTGVWAPREHDEFNHFIDQLEIWNHYQIVDRVEDSDITLTYADFCTRVIVIDSATGLTLYAIDTSGGRRDGSYKDQIVWDGQALVNNMKIMVGEQPVMATGKKKKK